MAGQRPNKKTHAKSEGEVRQWLGKMLSDSSMLAISQLQIPVPSACAVARNHDDQIAKIAFSKKGDSDLHALLKYAAWVWLDRQEFETLRCQSDLVRFEQFVYSPPNSEPEFRPSRNPEGGDFDWTMAQLVRRGDESVLIPDGGKRYTVDVFGKATNIEVGSTTPECLLTPFFEVLPDRAIWIPYPEGVDTKKFDIEDYDFKSAIAYQIEPRE